MSKRPPEHARIPRRVIENLRPTIEQHGGIGWGSIKYEQESGFVPACPYGMAMVLDGRPLYEEEPVCDDDYPNHAALMRAGFTGTHNDLIVAELTGSSMMDAARAETGQPWQLRVPIEDYLDMGKRLDLIEIVED